VIIYASPGFSLGNVTVLVWPA